MSSPTKKRRLPLWATSGNSPDSKDETKSSTSSTKVKEVKAPSGGERSDVRPSPAPNNETKSSAKTYVSKVELNEASTNSDYGDKYCKVKPCIKEELNPITDATPVIGKIAKASTTKGGHKENEIPDGKPERLSFRQAKVKEEPEDRVEDVFVCGDEPDRRKLFPINESEDIEETRRGISSESSRGEFQDALEKQKTDRGKYNDTAHVDADNSRSQQHQNTSVQSKFQDESRTHGGQDGEEKDVFASAYNGENKSLKPSVRKFSQLLDGVVFSISGLVNPERGELRQMALDMGAQYKPSWSSDSTLLIAAFANTPSFNQVKAVGGTIVHKDWIVDCHKRKELVAIEEYMLHAGNPWRAGYDVDESPENGVEQVSPNQIAQVEAHNTGNASDDHKTMPSTPVVKDTAEIPKVPRFWGLKATVDEVQHWLFEDLATLRTWLAEQDEKPEEDQMEYVAAQGLVACLEDAVKSLQENTGLKLVMDNWGFIPRAVKELEKELSHINQSERLVREAERIKLIYTTEIQKIGLGAPTEEDSLSTDDDATEVISDTDSRDLADFDSDHTEDLEEDEIAQCQLKIMSRFGLV
ncbi:DNA-repair protein XRCC1 [Marchantia polymorpha subsp. ruderalis]|nr:hypothetical protein AXG93_402s1290 [Marchantia polymorpha subsp. ruderalis]PTQ39578.1 hypothetical protein MARPO_0044s0047 [Marchantia polymorpha]PTQ39579.1 hypothetical protein MARPO_0044s0047 [Marchantia polymorpha]BBN07522.1 hypothetical protein Mp_4g04260 [Marchantia polymorpha subsp. ruderalis]BBN07523.1 hypothetical protein Mp_4g04260 [Marchantia polymorpha subsp. ruderalis]|eukprot:PTQ39578.1 hypothetical protein MARPO_0044s0047 [Marchantia polymorpha]